MNWTPQQQRALDSVATWLKNPTTPWFYLAGFAGTGKTTLAKHLAEGVPRACFGAPTGKAAQVMRSKGCGDATTIHRLIYNVSGRSDAKVVELEAELNAATAEDDETAVKKLKKALRKEKDKADRPSFSVKEQAALEGSDLLVIDECSMISQNMAEDILGFDVPVLALGDPAQLPPVRGSGYFTERDPDALLTDVVRQARGNPVLDLATMVRKGERLQFGTYGESRVMHYEDMSAADAFAADVILTGKNVTRRTFNRRQRELLERTSPYPLQGDKLIALTNNHEMGIYNGTTLVAKTDAIREHRDICLFVEGDELPEVCVASSTEAFEQYQDVDYRDPRSFWQKVDLIGLDFAYALTVHKSQGSQWNHVLLVDDRFNMSRPTARRSWLYTAITRAVQKVTVALS